MTASVAPEVRISHPDKIIYPETRFTKGQMAAYYAQVAPIMLPYLKGRPITLKRYPNGVEAPFFYEKNCPQHRPNYVDLACIPYEDPSKHETRSVCYCVLNNANALLWVVNLGSVELHPLLARAPKVNQPQWIVFDLDPGPAATIMDCAKIALELRAMLKQLKLESFVKNSGGKGLHVYIPLNTPVTYEKTKSFAHAVAMLLEKKYPEKVVSKMQKILREGKVLVDWSQNTPHKTTVCAYSLRAQKTPSVSTPLMWSEVEKLARATKNTAFRFTPEQVLARIKKYKDLFAPVLALKQKLPKLQV